MFAAKTDLKKDWMADIQISKVSLADIETLQFIGRKTFFETFADVNTESNMKKYLDENFDPERLKNELLNPDSEFYFSYHQNKVTGYLKVNFGPAQTELKDSRAMEIERIYVLKEYHGRKIGQMLLNKALQIAENSKSEYIWLGVWERNFRALNFYKKNGFVEFDKHIFKLGDDVQTDFMMKYPCESSHQAILKQIIN